MIMKTAVKSGGVFSFAHPLGFDKKFCYFFCFCGRTIRIMNDKPYIDKYARCRKCKEHERRLPHEPYWLVLRRIRADANNRGLSFDITLEDFMDLCHNPCLYCGEQNLNFAYGIRYNGLDRVDSSDGYSMDNCVPCCIICNRAKGNMTQKEFYMWISKISRKNGGHS